MVICVRIAEVRKMSKKGCKDCTERKVGCHSTCEMYLSEKAKREQKKVEIFKRMNEDKVVKDVLYMDVPDKRKMEMRYRIARKKRY